MNVAQFLTDSTIEEQVAFLQKQSDLYYNEGEAEITDAEYDAIERHVRLADPTNKYFLGIGSTVRGGKIDLPFPMGSLDQIYEGEFPGWVQTNRLGSESLHITDKLDGQSGMVVYDDTGNLQIAYSRGNGIQGADITRHISRMPSVPKNVKLEKLVVRGEIIISKENFKKIQTLVKSRSGKPYKNPRNAVAGMMNSSSNPDEVYQYIDFVVYSVVSPDTGLDKAETISLLSDLGFKTVYGEVHSNTGKIDDEYLTSYLNSRRDVTVYEIDGIVIEPNSYTVCESMMVQTGEQNLNPDYAIKYKVADANNFAIATVSGVNMTASKHGYLKPTIAINPVDLVGVTVSKCTGFNMGYIRDNKIQPGCRIRLTRSGDVIPHCLGVHDSGKLFGSEYDEWFYQNIRNKFGDSVTWTWTDTNVDLVLDTNSMTDEQQLNRLVDFFAAVEVPFLREGNIQVLIEHGYDTIDKIINVPEIRLIGMIGSNGSKIYNGIRDKLHNIPLHKLMGAYINERGIGVRKIKKLQVGLGGPSKLTSTVTIAQIAKIEGFDRKTAEKVARGMEDFWEFYLKVDQVVSYDTTEVESTGSFNGMKICLTGFRDKEMSEHIETNGGTVQSAVSGTTTLVVAANANSTSGKLKKARDLGIKIISKDEFKQEYM